MKNRKERAREFRCAGTLAAQGASDAQAVAMPSLYPEWAAGVKYGADSGIYIVLRDKQLYRLREGKDHTSQTGWEAENAPDLWVAINNTNAGTVDDPIPAVRGMEYTYGLYYTDPEDGKIYLCTRSGEVEGGAVVLQFLPHELVGHYFEEATG